MQKSLQIKLMNLYTKRDSLQKQISGTSTELDKEEYDQLEREVYKIQE